MRLVHRRGGGEDPGADVGQPRHLEQPLDRAVLAVRAVQHREHDVEGDRVAAVERPVAAEVARRRRAPRAGRNAPPAARSPSIAKAWSASGSTQVPSRVMPIGTSSQGPSRSASSTLPAETQEIACSLLRPPKSTARRGRVGSDACRHGVGP